MNKKTDAVIELATQLVQKEMQTGSDAHSPELLSALSTVAAALKTKSGNDAAILGLVAQVEKVVKAQVLAAKK
jgi:hypothetical protein